MLITYILYNTYKGRPLEPPSIGSTPGYSFGHRIYYIIFIRFIIQNHVDLHIADLSWSFINAVWRQNISAAGFVFIGSTWSTTMALLFNTNKAYSGGSTQDLKIKYISSISYNSEEHTFRFHCSTTDYL